MLFSEPIFLGVDPTAGKKPMLYAALDRELNIVALDRADLESLLAFVASLGEAVIAIDGPQRPNSGLMSHADVRRRFDLRPSGKTWAQWRVCEYELRRRNIRLYNTPDREEDCPGWVRGSFQLFKRLSKMGLREFYLDGKGSGRRMLEARAHAGYTVLLGHRPFLKRTLEGRLQRQLVLFLEGVDVANPMHALEEITRHHLLSGHLPLESLKEPDALDALLTAYTAYLAATDPGRVLQVGEREEGLITLPKAKLEAFYA